jgi:hypothetical protein
MSFFSLTKENNYRHGLVMKEISQHAELILFPPQAGLILMKAI